MCCCCCCCYFGTSTLYLFLTLCVFDSKEINKFGGNILNLLACLLVYLQPNVKKRNSRPASFVCTTNFLWFDSQMLVKNNHLFWITHHRIYPLKCMRVHVCARQFYIVWLILRQIFILFSSTSKTNIYNISNRIL